MILSCSESMFAIREKSLSLSTMIDSCIHMYIFTPFNIFFHASLFESFMELPSDPLISERNKKHNRSK